MLYTDFTLESAEATLGLSVAAVTLHRPRLYIDAVGSVLAAFGRAVAE